MSLELALHENTAAIRDLIAHLTSASPTAVTMTAAAYVATLDKPVAALAIVKSPELDAAVEVIEKAAAVVVPVALDYTKDIKPLLVKLSTSKGRDALVGLLAKYGVAKGDALPAGLLGAVANEINVLLAA